MSVLTTQNRFCMVIAYRFALQAFIEVCFPVNDNNTKQLIDYFDKVLAWNEIQRGHMVDRIGYVKSGLAYPLLATGYEIIPSD